MLRLEFGQLVFGVSLRCTFSHGNYPTSFQKSLQIQTSLRPPRLRGESIVEPRAASRLAIAFLRSRCGYSADKALAKRRKSGPRSCSACNKALKAFVRPLPGEASPHGLGPTLSLPDSFLDLYPFPSCLLFFCLLPSAPRLSCQEKASIEK